MKNMNMNELQKLIEKWDEQIALHRRVCEDPLMYTKEDRLKNSHYAQAICAVVADLKKLTIPDVLKSVCIKPDYVICCLNQNDICTENIEDCEFRQTVL